MRDTGASAGTEPVGICAGGLPVSPGGLGARAAKRASRTRWC